MKPVRVATLVGVSLLLTASIAAAQTSSEAMPRDNQPMSIRPIRVTSGQRVNIDAEGDPAALSLQGVVAATSTQCTTPCQLTLPMGTYSVEAVPPDSLSTSITVDSRPAYYRFRRGGAGIGWKFLTIGGAVIGVSGLIWLGLGVAGTGSSSSIGRGFGTVSIFLGVLSLVASAAMLIPGAVGWANAPGPSLREVDNELARLDAARSRRIALMRSGAIDVFASAPSTGFVPSYTVRF
jgi:hypothetical protein